MLWNEYIDSCAAEIKLIVLQDSQRYDFECEIKPVLVNAFIKEPALLDLAHHNFVKVIAEINERFTLCFPQSGEIAVYFYAGLCNGAGWATTIGNVKSVLLGAEKIVELKWQGEAELESLICHELCHIAHEDLRGGFVNFGLDERANQAVWQLYIEGFAQRYEQVLAGKDGYYHQDKNGWLNWCRENKSALAAAYHDKIRSNESVQEFFGDWSSFMGHPDTGYYLGCEFILSLEQRYSRNEIACMNYDEIYLRVVSFLVDSRV